VADEDVSQNAPSRHQRYMRYLFAAGVLSALLIAARSTTRIEAYLAATVQHIKPLEHIDVNTITYTATLPDGSTLTYTATQQPGETFEAFSARAAREWAIVKADNGL